MRGNYLDYTHQQTEVVDKYCQVCTKSCIPEKKKKEIDTVQENNCNRVIKEIEAYLACLVAR